MERFPDILIGMQLVGWDDQKKILTFRDDNKILDIAFDDSDEGDCCGYNDFFAELLVSDHDVSLNPIITSIEVERSYDKWKDNDHVNITFFGGAKKLFLINSESGSGSGCCYGACVTVKCDAINLNESVTDW